MILAFLHRNILQLAASNGHWRTQVCRKLHALISIILGIFTPLYCCVASIPIQLQSGVFDSVTPVRAANYLLTPAVSPAISESTELL